jgi:hypothetical protein
MKRGDDRAEPARPTVEEIEREIASTRTEIGRTADALKRRLAPGYLLGEGIEMITKYMAGQKDIGVVIRANRVPLALIAAGVGWLVANKIRVEGRIVVTNAAQPADETSPLHGRRHLSAAGRYPLLLGLGGVVFGAGLAALLPPSRREREWVDKAREELWRAVEEIGHDAADHIRNLAGPSEDRPQAP